MNDLSEIIRSFQERTNADSLSGGVSVEFDERTICIRRETRDGYAPLVTRFAWQAILRICFKDNGPMASDIIYLFVDGNAQLLTVPLESEGGGYFWRELRARGIFPKTLHEQATLSTDGRLYCWPPAGVRSAARR